MKKIFLLLAFFVIQDSFCQDSKAWLGQYYSFCTEWSDWSEEEQKIDSIYKKENKWTIVANVRDKCIVRLYPYHTIQEDTLKIKMLEITEYSIELENGEGFIEVQDEYECLCLYEVKMEFYLENVNHVTINGILKKINAFKN